jgi:hypothetical protein
MVIEKAMPPIIIAGLTYLVLQITNKMWGEFYEKCLFKWF